MTSPAIKGMLLVREMAEPSMTPHLRTVLDTQVTATLAAAADNGIDLFDPPTARAVAFGVLLHQLLVIKAGDSLPTSLMSLQSVPGWTQSAIAEVLAELEIEE